jgi:glycosyltransferase involved in cell wall biosynthesis
MPLISISDHQREPMPANAKWLSTIHHGIPDDLYPFRKETGTYLAFLGRIAPEKRPDRAIEIARRAGLPLKIAAKVDAQDRDYFRRHIEPLLENPPIEFIGEISDSQKAEFLGNARALLFPVDWPEPFGLVMIEAMASGTPVIGWRRGSVPEVIDEGVTGLVVDSLDDAVAAVERSASIDRRLVRERFEARFTSFRMAKQYLSAYERLVASGTMRPLSGYHVPNTPRSALLRSSDLVPPSAGAPGFPQPENS